MGVRSDNAAFIETRLRELASKGLTSHEAAEATGWGYHQIRSYARRFGIEFAKAYRVDGDTERAARADDFARRYQAGETLASIGESAGITRERVRQILTRTRGFDATDGGQFVKAAEKARQRETLRDRDSRARWGCSREAATKRVAARIKTTVNTIDGILRERTKRVCADLRSRIVTAALSDIEKQIEQLSHEKRLLEAMGFGPSCDDYRAAEAALSTARECLARMRAAS